jgi:hypothetical protein
MQILRWPTSKVQIMKTFRVPLALFAVFLALTFGPAVFAAQPGATSATTGTAGAAKPARTEPAQKKARPLPFQGKIKTIDKAAGTFAIGERTFIVTAESKVMKRDKSAASLATLAAGEHVTGSYRKAEDGRLLVNTLYIGPKEEAAETSPTKATPKKDTGKSK